MFGEYCSQCGECCRNIEGVGVPFPLDYFREIEISGTKEQKKLLEEVEHGIIPFKKGTHDCSMLIENDDNTYSCAIQAIKPPKCSRYPYHLMYNETHFDSCTVPVSEVLQEIRRKEDLMVGLTE